MALIAALRRLDRDHIRAEVAEHLDPHRPHEEMVEADDTRPTQQIEHCVLP